VTHPTRFQTAIAVLLLICWTAPRLRAKPNLADLHERYDKLSQEFAASNPDWRPKALASGALLFLAPDEYSPLNQTIGAVSTARSKYAAALFELATEAAKASQLSLAFQWATETLRENPEHAEARRALGYEQRGGHWLTGYGAKMLDAGKTWHPEFGWIAAADVGRYEKGERLAGGRWISAANDAAQHSAMKNGWQIRTDHFIVITNHSLAAATDLAARLERLYQMWRQLFAGFYLSDKEVRGLFMSTAAPRAQARPFRVYYHRDRNQYIAALRSRQSRIDETLGIYFDTFHEAHFFAGDQQDRGTLYHEAVHQLFQESKPAARHIGAVDNAWVIEGAATYFETLDEHSDSKAGRYYTIGESTKGRLRTARQQMRDGYYVPLDKLVRLGKDELQQPANIAKRYSQSCGLAAYLIDGEHGRYREPLVRYLQAIYAGHDGDQTLAEATGASYPELDAAYRRYMESLP
jgi:hypothetical protein